MPFQSLDALLHLRQEFSQIDSVYVFYSNEMDTAKDVEVSSGVYTNIESLCNHLRQVPTIQRDRREGFLRDDFTLSSLSRAALPSTPSPSTSQLLPSPLTDITTNRQEAEFMYAQFLRDILVEMESTEEEMIEFCREKCASNKTELNVVDEFEAYYDAINAIFGTHATHFSILKQRHASQQQTSTIHGPPPTTSAAAEQIIETVYRGQLMDNEEFDKKIRHNTGGFFSVSSFLSTTLHKNLATVYAGNRSNNKTPSEQSVLFQIDIDKIVNKFPYANISSESAFDKDEDEILFTMGAVFRIESIDLSDEGIWNVKLKLTGEEDEELRKLTEHIREDVLSTSPLGSLARMMMEMAKYDKAEKYHLLLLEDPTNTEDFKTLSAIYNNLGYIHNGMGRVAKAIEYYENALDIKLKHLPANDSSLASGYNNLANIYRQQSEYEKALSYFHKAIAIDLNAVNPNPNKIANRYNNIGLVYHAQQRYSEALAMFEQCLNIQSEALPSNHPGIATSHSNISQVYHSLADYEKTIEYLNRTLQIQINSLPPNHPDIARTYNNLGQAYDRQGKLREAVEMYDKSLEIDLKILPLNHPTILIIYNNISLVINSLRDYDKAIECLNPTLQIELDSLSSNHTELAGIYHNLANAYYHTGKLKEALEINKKSLEIRSKVLPTNHPDLAASYNNISQVYDSLGNYNRAIEYLDQTLQVQISSHPPDYPVLA
ncbi:unnamed protein product [Didymodactylos carnosus]|uniref:Uncharacterized protein n=1 Tax=Didymodactylos carnosus TaxID=1234261 RepID=A0A8S2CQ87_9BILA|nr:unnamed protein product [Didymodactylos carnosus]CAF3557098.1 unnamed protein product [Didymodactylos carnosus]